MPATDATASTQAWYRDYYERKGADRNDLIRNPEVLFQSLAMDASVVNALRSTGLRAESSTVLDVGCGSGASMLNLLRCGFAAANVQGVDILEDRIEEARARLPHVRFHCADARAMAFPDGAFDLVTEWTMFVQVTDLELGKAIAREMLRVTRPGGFVLLVDWRYSKPGDAHYRGLTKARVRELFDVGSSAVLHAVQPGAMVPPIGRLLSRRLPSCYFLVRRLAPFLTGQVAVILRKVGSGEAVAH